MESAVNGQSRYCRQKKVSGGANGVASGAAWGYIMNEKSTE